jgi:hypothetical protein
MALAQPVTSEPVHLADIGDSLTYCDKPVVGLVVTFHEPTATCPDCISVLRQERS